MSSFTYKNSMKEISAFTDGETSYKKWFDFVEKNIDIEWENHDINLASLSPKLSFLWFWGFINCCSENTLINVFKYCPSLFNIYIFL